MEKVKEIHTERGKYKYLLTIKEINKFRYQNGELQKEEWYLINLGGKTKYCVQMKIPKKGDIANLLWLEAGKELGDCSIDEHEQKGERLVYLTKLAFSIAKKLNNHLEHIDLQDNAKFVCELPDGRKVTINSTDHDLAFYQLSYYEKRYGAYLIHEQQKKYYEEAKKGFSDPNKKEGDFDFRQNEIYEALMPLYIKSKTWKDFFDAINIRYKNRKCTAITPWIQKALAKIMGGVSSYSGLEWRIDIKNIPLIEYEEKDIQKGGGLRKTRKKIMVDKEPTVPELLEMDWASFFKNPHKSIGNRKNSNIVKIEREPSIFEIMNMDWASFFKKINNK